MKIRIIMILSAMVIAVTASGQAEYGDTIIVGESYPDSIHRTVSDVELMSCQQTMSFPLFGQYVSSVRPDISHMPEIFVRNISFTPGQAILATWKNGALAATGGSIAMPGLMSIESGSLGVNHNMGDFNFYGGGTVNKYGYFRGLHTQYGITGTLSYLVSPKLRLQVFGSYYFGSIPVMSGGLPMPFSMLGYYGASNFGGSVYYQMNELLGVEAGGQMVRRIGSNRYEAEPIVTPYLNLGSGKTRVRIGLPVGQIIYGILRRR